MLFDDEIFDSNVSIDIECWLVYLDGMDGEFVVRVVFVFVEEMEDFKLYDFWKEF